MEEKEEKQQKQWKEEAPEETINETSEETVENETEQTRQKLYAIEQGEYLIRHQQADKGADTGSGEANAYCLFELISTALKQKHKYEIYGDIPYDRA